MYYFMDKDEIAVAITADWEMSGASTISPADIQLLQDEAPMFGVLNEKGGKKVYAFLPDGTIKKKVIHARSGCLYDTDRVLPSIKEGGFVLKSLHREFRM